MSKIKIHDSKIYKIFIPPIIIALVNFWLPSFILAQEEEIKFSHITVEDGLTSNAVAQIIQDRNGFIWFGTFNGLTRFDGYNLKAFLPEPNNPKSISNHSIWSLEQDNIGNIWCGTQDGLNKYDPITEQFLRYKNNPKDAHSISNNHITCIHKDHEGILWIGTLNGLNKYNPVTNNFTVYKKVTPLPNKDSLNSVTCIQEDKDGNLWLGTWNGLIQMQKDGKIIKRYFEDAPSKIELNNRKVICLFRDNSKNIWVGTSTLGLQKYDAITKKFIAYRYSQTNPNSISNDYITAIYQDKMNNIWVGTRNGLNKLNTATNKFTRVLNDPQKPLSIINNEILSIYEDNNSLMWIGNSGGVSRFYQTINRFNYIQENDKSPTLGLTNDRVTAITLDTKNNVWTGTIDGVNKIEYGTKKITRLLKNKSTNSIGSNHIYSIYQDHTGIIWIGTNGISLNKYNPFTGEIKQFTYNPKDTNTISNKGVTTICEDRKGNMWFGTWWGLNMYDRSTNKFTRYLTNKKNINSLKVDPIWKIVEDSEGLIWIATDGGGISRFNPKTKIFSNFFHDSTHTNTISGNIGITIFESRDGIMWFGTNNGLTRYDRKTGMFKSYSKENGLPGIYINSIIEDNNGQLWIGTDKGLSRFDIRTETFSNFSIRDGVKNLDFSPRASAIDKNGILYFGTKRGLLFFDPSTIRERTTDPAVVFTDLKIYNQSVPITTDGSTVLNRSIIGATSIIIPDEDDMITLEFSLLDFYNPRENVFSYKLEGFDTKWNMVGNRNSATYTNLPPGEYKFIVRAYNNSGTKNRKEASLLITIVPVFYQTFGFKIMGLLLLILFIVLFAQVRTRIISRTNRMLELRVAERTKDLDITINELSREVIERKKAEEKVYASLGEKEILLKEVHHRVKNNLQVISSLLYLQTRYIKDEDTLNLFNDSQNRIKSMALIHEKLYQSKDFARISFKDYVTSLIDYLNTSYQKSSQFITTKVYIGDLTLSLNTAISCGLIVNELVTNTFKYAFPSDWISKKENGFKPKIEITTENIDQTRYRLKVHDNGIGFANEIDIEKNESLGLKIVNSMVNQLDGSINISQNGGTTFTIEFTDEK